MSEWKTFNDGYCFRCGEDAKLFQPADFRNKGKGSKAKRWYCPKCLKAKFDIEEFEIEQWMNR